MPSYELLIPPNQPDGLQITARIQADSWLDALRNGLSRIGDPTDVRSVLCDIKETCIDVTEPASGRVFRITELVGDVDASEATSASAIASQPQAAAASAATSGSGATDTKRGKSAKSETSAEAVADGAAVAQDGQPRGADAAAERIGREREELDHIEDLLSELMAQTQDIYKCKDLQEAAGFLLDLAMRTVRSDSGAVFISDINANDLYFACARGPKADDVVAFRVPMGQGIVGFSAQEGVSLAVSDVQKDPRFYAKISEKIGYETRSIACTPAQSEGRVFGAIELINKSEGNSFTGTEVNLLNFLAHEFAEYLINTGQTGD